MVQTFCCSFLCGNMVLNYPVLSCFFFVILSLSKGCTVMPFFVILSLSKGRTVMPFLCHPELVEGANLILPKSNL